MVNRNRRPEGASGFTLIELLVVIIIMGVLAAIAIPTFFNQRIKGWEASAKSVLKNAATAQEAYFTEHSKYAPSEGDLVIEGYNTTSGVSVLEIDLDANETAYVMCVRHLRGGDKFYIRTEFGVVQGFPASLGSASAACPAA